eukprot:TRINITY_DN111123_c0_g1_i1.p1 TRINITY_DN111123_c0_g1~~TRINITY_DN111123_c0_g1_i1.p1  ORF type:complete len:620 (+),score=85.86 TRINITY_DN111123_c0_g1_i1:87-1862(+)
MADVNTGCADLNLLVWKRREKLVLPGIWPGQWISLPFFRDENTSLGPMVFTDEKGVILEYCRDQLYDADDHELLWIKFGDFHWGEEEDTSWQSSDYQAVVFMYSNIEQQNEEPLALSAIPPPVGLSRPENVFSVAEYFSESNGNVNYENSPDNGNMEEASSEHSSIFGWQRKARGDDDPETLSKYLSVGPVDDHLPAQPFKEPPGQALMMDPGMGREVLWCAPRFRFHGTSTRLHLRSYFYDHMRTGALASISEKSAHWIGIQSPVGSAAIGVTSECTGSYAFLNGCCPDGSAERNLQWETTSVPRSAGWHLFELVFQDNSLQVLVDGEPMAHAAAEGATETLDSLIYLVAKKGDPGYWASVELLHTPMGNGWESGVQSRVEGDRNPWQQLAVETGRWHVEERVFGPSNVLDCARPVMVGSLDVDRIPPAPVPDPAPTPVADPAPEPPLIGRGALAIECWSLPGEGDLERVERAMSTFIEHLVTDGVVVPDNVSRVATCAASQHPNCYVYRFGTRRLHVGVQAGVCGRLSLVVRVGGGFMDFAEFARRHGRMEQIRLHQSKPSEGRTVVRLTSVLSKGQREVKPSSSQRAR